MKSLTQITNLLDVIKNQPSVRQASRWYETQNARDKWIIKILAAVLVLLLVYWLILSPAISSNKEIKSKLAKNVALYNLIADNAHRFGQVSLNNANQAPLLNLINQQAQQNGINLNRYEQSDSGVKVWLENVAFDKAISWLENLNAQSGVLVKQINVDKQTLEGHVNLRATLSR